MFDKVPDLSDPSLTNDHMNSGNIPFIHPRNLSGIITAYISDKASRKTVVRNDCIEGQTASEAFGEGTQALVIESAVGTDHGCESVNMYKIKYHGTCACMKNPL